MLCDFADVVDDLLRGVIAHWVATHLLAHAELDPSIADGKH